jgi:hypothetical protein
LSLSGGALSWLAGIASGASNVPNRKDFSLVLQCQNVAKSAAMQTTAESQSSPRVPAPDASATAGEGRLANVPSSSTAAAGTPLPDAAVGKGPHAGAGATDAPRPREIGGRDGPEPTRFGDWEKAGRCIDF